MAILDIFRKKKKPEKPAKKEIKKEPVEKKPTAKPEKTRRASVGTACRVLKEPHVSEKATDLTKKDWYAFRVLAGANKSEIKKAIEELYGVEVVSVRIVNIPRKKRRLGKIEGWRRGYKKALVRLRAGQKIEALPR